MIDDDSGQRDLVRTLDKAAYKCMHVQMTIYAIWVLMYVAGFLSPIRGGSGALCSQ